MLNRVAIATAASLWASQALAFDTTQLGQMGSTDMEDMKELVDKTPKLRAEVDEAMAQVNKTEIQVKCAGQRFPGSWNELGGTRVAPYLCAFAGDKWLLIEADVRLTDKRGHVYDKPTKQAMQRAENISETKLRWSWSAKAPAGWDWFTNGR
jgi:hypothetical protein